MALRIVDWPGRWEIKAKIVDLALATDTFRRNSVLMDGIQTHVASFDIMWDRAERWGVPLDYCWDSKEVGKPAGKDIEGKFFTAGSLKHGITCHRIKSFWGQQYHRPIDVIEIGGGYGGLVTAALRAFDMKSYTIIDDPTMHKIQALYISAWAKEFSFNLPEINLVEPYLVEYPTAADLIVSTNALCELTPPECQKYLRMIKEVLQHSGCFYSVNTMHYHVNPLSFRQTLGEGDFTYPIDDLFDNHKATRELMAVRKERG
jgi:hypothetical protein